MSLAQVYCERFIGRREQLALLKDRLADATRGQGSLVLIGGEAGIGKTRFITHFASSDRSGDTLFVTGQCLEYASSPFGAFRALLDALFAAQPSVLKAHPDLMATAAAFVPSLRPGEGPANGAPRADKLSQFDALARIIGVFAQARPLVLAIEDLHWSDLDSLQLLQHVLPSLRSMGVLLLATYRPHELQPSNKLSPVLARLGRYPNVWQCTLEALNDADMMSMLHGSLPAGDRPAPSVLESVLRLAEGVPLNAEELLKSALLRDASDPARLATPPSARDAVLQRLNKLNAAQRAIIAHAATLGRRFDPEFLADAMGRPLGDIVDALKSAVDLQLVIEEGPDKTGYAFRHALTRQAIYDQLLGLEARLLHAHIAAALEARDAAPARVVELAYHYWKARNWEKSTSYNELAGDAAMQLYAYNDAMESYQRALSHPSLSSEREATLRRKLGDSAYAAGVSSIAQTSYESAVTLFERVAAAEEAALSCLALVRVCWDDGDLDAAFRTAARALAITEVTPESAARFGAQVLLARLMAYRGDPHKALTELVDAERLLTVGHKNHIFTFYWARAIAHSELDDLEASVADFRRAISLAEEQGDTQNLLGSYHVFAVTMTILGREAEALGALDTACSLAVDKRLGGSVLASLLGAYAWSAQQFGKLEKAKDVLDRALVLTVDERRFRISALASIGISLGVKLQDAELIERCADPRLVEEAFSRGKDLVFQATLAFVELHVSRGEMDEARKLLHRVVALGAQAYQDDVEVFVRVAQHGDARDLPAARELLLRPVAIAGRTMERAQLALFDAYAAQRQGDGKAVTTAATTAAEFFHRLSWPLHEARALELLGDAYKARALYEAAGDRQDVQRMDGERMPGRRVRQRDDLTPRELEVARLVAAGRSNRQVADALSISERTVENHVASAYQKLGVKTRVELALRIGSLT